MLLHEIEKIENGRCLTGDGALGDLVGEAVSFATEITEKNARGTDSKEEWFEPLGLNDTTKALIRLFSSEKKISDSELHSLADSLNVSPQTLEEEVYSLLQSFFSKGRYMSSDYFVPDEGEVKKGDKIELEHTDSPIIARRITLDHLAEIKDYNSRLLKMEKEGETKDGGVGSGVKGHMTSKGWNAPNTSGKGFSSGQNVIVNVEQRFGGAKKTGKIKSVGPDHYEVEIEGKVFKVPHRFVSANHYQNDSESIETEDPLTEKGQHILAAMKEHYGEEKGTEVFYRSKNAGTISGVDKASCKDGGIGSGIQGHVTSRYEVPGGFIQENKHAYMSQVGNRFVVWGKKNGGLQKMGESANALEAAHMYWGIRDCKMTGDGGVGSGIKGHITPKQVEVIKAKRRISREFSSYSNYILKSEKQKLFSLEGKKQEDAIWSLRNKAIIRMRIANLSKSQYKSRAHAIGAELFNYGTAAVLNAIGYKGKIDKDPRGDYDKCMELGKQIDKELEKQWFEK